MTTLTSMVAAILATQSLCSAPTGTDALLAMDRRIIVVGEMHGTAETPAAFGAIVCEAAAKGPVAVALEFPHGVQEQLDAFLAADTDDAAMSALQGTPLLDPTFTDGRTSLAMFDMMQAARRLRVDGRDVTLHAFQPSSHRPRDMAQAYGELEMGFLLSRVAMDRPEAKVLALVGNIHARKTPNERLPHVGLPATAHLPASDTVSLYVALQGGQAWNCRQTCGVHDQASNYAEDVRGVIMGDYGDGAFDGVLALGPTTASPPATVSR